MQQLDWVLVVEPMHDAPPQLGAGLLQERVRVRVAGPQLDDHDPTVHDVHAPLAAFVRKVLECKQTY